MADPQTLARMLMPPENPAAAPKWAQEVAYNTFVQPIADAYKAQSPQDLLAPMVGAMAPPMAKAGMLAKGLAPEANALTKGIRAYHGSPYDFDRFDLSKIGTGEGAQAYGHGLYFAGNEKVAKEYRDQLAGKVHYFNGEPLLGVKSTGNSLADKIVETMRNSGVHDTFAAADIYAGKRPEFATGQGWRELRAARDWLTERVKGEQKPGHMYEVNLNVSPDQLLDWDRPLREQPHLRPTIEGILGPQEISKSNVNWAGDMLKAGGNILAEFPKGQVPDDPMGVIRGQSVLSAISPANQPRQMEILRDAGIPGIQYLDQGSRSAGEGTRNYVMFDPELIKIVRKYGLAGLTAGPALGAALSQQDGQNGGY